MAKWKKPKLWVIVCAAIICIGVLVACAMNPASGNEQAESTEPTAPTEASESLWIAEAEPEEACLQAINELRNAESYYISYSFESAGTSGTTTYRRHGNDLLVDSGPEWFIGVSNIYFDGSFGRFLGDYWVWEEESMQMDPNDWLTRYSPEEKEITIPAGGGLVNYNTITFNAVWPHQMDSSKEYQGTFTYTFYADGSLASIERAYVLVAEGEAATATTDRITILEEAPEDTYAAIKAVADQCIPASQLEQIRYDAKIVTEVPSNKTQFDQDFELGAGTKRWFFLNEDWSFAFGAEDSSSTDATLIHQESADGHQALVAEEGFWLEEMVDGKWQYVDENITMADAPEVSVNVSWDKMDSYHINWLDTYGELKPGYYRIGRNYTVTLDSGKSETQVCYAKFRIMEKETDQLLKKCNDALEALLTSDSYHIRVTDWNTQHADEAENDYMSYYMTREIWKSGGDYLAEYRYINRVDPSILESRRGELYRDGVGYTLEWSGNNVTSPLSSWQSNTYRESGDFELWTISTAWYDSLIIGIIGDASSIDIISEYDFDDKYDSTCVTLYFDADSNLTKIESVFLLGPSDTLQEKIVDVTVEILPTSAKEIARVVDSQDVSKPVPFSFDADKAKYPDAQTSGFVNTGRQTVSSMADAIAIADKECTLTPNEWLDGKGYNITSVYFDETAKMWKVLFEYSPDSSVWQAIYLDHYGITKMVVTG